MAETQFLSANRLTEERWPRTFFDFTLQNMQLSKFMGPSSDEIIQVINDLKKGRGDLMTLRLAMPLTNAGGTDDSNIEGNETSMDFFNFQVQIHERSNGVRSAGEMTDKRTGITLRIEASRALGRWAAEQMEQDLIWALSGLGNQGTEAGEATSSILTVNEHAPSSDRILYGGQTIAGVKTFEATDSAIGDAGGADALNFLFGTKVIDVAKRKAQLSSPKFRTINVGGKWYYVMFIHPLQTKSIQAETGVAGWTQIQANANVRGINNPLFTREGAGPMRMFDGAVGVWNDVILFELERIETRVAGQTFDNGDTIDAGIVNGTYRVARALLCGAQAGVVAWGKPWRRLERDFDYFRKPGTAIVGIYGASKTLFNDPGVNQSTNTAQQDFAVIAVDTAVVDD